MTSKPGRLSSAPPQGGRPSLQQLPLEKGEELLLQSDAKYRENHPGILYLTNQRLLWARRGAPFIPQTSIRLADIKSQMVSVSGAPQLKVVTDEAEDLRKAAGHVFEFVSSNAVIERDAFKELLASLLPKRSRAPTASTGSLSSSHSSSSSSLPTSSETTPSISVGELQRRAALLTSNKDLALLHKQLVKTNIITEDEFWQSRQEMLENESMKGFNQPVGLSSSLVSDVRAETLASTGAMQFVLTPTIIQHIFLEYPAVHRAYLENVPTKMTDQEFWTRYCESQYVLQSRRSNPNAKITIAQQDELFEKCAEDDEKETSLPVTENLKSVDPIKCLGLKEHPEEGYQRPDVLNVPEKLNRSLPLIRRLNRHGNLVLDSHRDPLSAAQSALSEGRVDPLRSEAGIPDLDEKTPPEYIPLNIPDPRKYFEGSFAITPAGGSAGNGNHSNGNSVSGVDPIVEQLLINKSASKVFEEELKRWRKKVADRRQHKAPVPKVEREKANAVLKEVTAAQNTVTTATTNSAGAEQIPEEVKQDLLAQFVTVNELLRHFWRLFPMTPEKQNKLDRLYSAIRKQLKALKGGKHKSYEPLREALKKAKAKRKSLPPPYSSRPIKTEEPQAKRQRT